MSLDRPPGWTHTVRSNWEKTQGFLLASTEPCLAIRDDELAAVRDNRILVGVGLADLAGWTPSGSWILGVVVCPTDDVGPLVDWMAKQRKDADRVYFYLHPSTKGDVLRPWLEAGFPTHNVSLHIDTWERLHKRFGLALNDRVYADAGP